MSGSVYRENVSGLGYGFFLGYSEKAPQSRLMRGIATVLALALGWSSGPSLAFARPSPKPAPYSLLKPGLTQTPDAALRQKIAARETAEREKARPDIRPLTEQEKKGLTGRGPYRNKYFTGMPPWQRSLRDVNLTTGNLFKSFTDIQIAPGRGAGLVLQRTYNSNDDREGPFGIGWTHAYDIRIEDAPDSAPETDPNTGDDIVPRTDFFGGKHQYRRDADGLYSPPAYMFDEMDSKYTDFLTNGPQRSLEDVQRGMDGTVKHFIPEGTDASGKPSKVRVCDYIEDRHGNRTELFYDMTVIFPDGSTKKLLTVVKDPTGRDMQFTWSNLGTAQQPAYRITQAQGPFGTYRVTYDYNAEKNLSAVHLDTDGLNRTTTYGYTTVQGPAGYESGLLSSITDPLGHSVVYTYSFTDPATNSPVCPVTVTGVDETGSGGVAYWISPPTVSTNYGGGYYTNGMPIATTFGVVGYTGMSACASDLQLRVIGFRAQDADYADPFWTYDTANNVLTQGINRVTYVDPVVTGQATNESSATTVSTYGPHGNILTQSVQGFNGTTTTEYYDASKYFQKKKVTDPLGRVTEMDYYPKVTYITNPTAQDYGRQGNVMWVRDARYATTGKQATYDYNQYGQKVSETNLNDVTMTFEYGDAAGNLTKLRQDPTGLNRTTTMVYDSAGRVTSSTDPNGQSSAFAYNKFGQLTVTTLPTSVQGVAGETVSYVYGANGRTESMSDGRGTTTISYVPGADRVASVTDPQTGTISFTYTPLGERKSVTYPNGEGVTYYYHGETDNRWFPSLGLVDGPDKWARNLLKIVDSSGRQVDIGADTLGLHAVYFNQTFDSGGNRTRYCVTRYSLFENGTYGTATRGRLQAIETDYVMRNQYGYEQSTLLSRNAYTYDNAGQRTANQITNNLGNVRTEQYGYDELNRLTSVNYGDGQTQGYSFDAMGNRLTKTDSVAGNDTLTYNNANMLLSQNSDAYINDANGNTLTGGGRTNTWDSQNRLVQCINGTGSSQQTNTFTYGADGLRHKILVTNADGSQSETTYILDGQNVVQESIRQRASGSSSWSTPSPVNYLLGPTGPMYRQPSSAADVRWYVFDGLGSVLAEVDVNGSVTASKKYDVYGLNRGVSGTPTSKHGFVGQLGHTTDDGTGLVYMRARYYDPVSGRFVSEDPVFHGANWYVYCSDNPVTRTDSSGKSDEVRAAIVFFGACNDIASFVASLTGNHLLAVAFAALSIACMVAGTWGLDPDTVAKACLGALSQEVTATYEYMLALMSHEIQQAATVGAGVALVAVMYNVHHAHEIMAELIAQEHEPAIYGTLY